MITSIIIHYKRPGNIPGIVKAIRAQTVPGEIWIWDNSGDCPDAGQDLTVRTTRNFVQMGQLMLLQSVKSEYIWLNDDDGSINDVNLFKKLINEIGAHPDCMLGWKGKRFDGTDIDKEKPYQNKAGWVPSGSHADMINNGFAFFHRRLLNKIICNPFDELTEEEHQHADDIHTSSKINVRSSAYIYDSVDRLDEQGRKLSGESHHMEIRNKLCRRYWL